MELAATLPRLCCWHSHSGRHFFCLSSCQDSDIGWSHKSLTTNDFRIRDSRMIAHDVAWTVAAGNVQPNIKFTDAVEMTEK